MKLIMISCLALLCTSCTLSFQNISTHGTANDLVDQTQDAKGDAQVSVPAIP